MLQSWVHKNRNHKAKENIAFLLYRQCDLLSGGVWLCIDTFFIQIIDRRLICPQWDMNLYYCKFISPSCSLPTVRPLWATTQNREDEMKVKDFSTIKNSGHHGLRQRKLGLWNGLKWEVHTLVLEHKVQQDQRKEQIFHHMSQLFCSCISSSFLKSDDWFKHYFKTVASFLWCKNECSNNIYHQTVMTNVNFWVWILKIRRTKIMNHFTWQDRIQMLSLDLSPKVYLQNFLETKGFCYQAMLLY